MPNVVVDTSDPNEPPPKPERVVVPFPRPPGRGGDDCPEKSGDIGARLREVFREHRSNLIRFLQLRLGSEADAQDAAQDAIARLFQRRETLRDQELRALLYVTARNIAIDRLRERQRSPLRFGDDAGIEPPFLLDEAASPERTAIAQQQLASIRIFLKELPPKCEQAFVSYKFDGLEYREIAAQMDLTESMVRKYVLRALAHCAARLAAQEGSP